MTRLIDADALKENAYKEGGAQSVAEMVVTVSDIDEAPTVDAVPVIRCKDCRYLRYNGSAWTCANRAVKMLNEMDDYCSRAERKEE